MNENNQETKIAPPPDTVDLPPELPEKPPIEEPKEKKKKRNILKEYSKHIKRNRTTYIVYLLLRISVIVSFILALLNHNYENAAICVLAFVLFSLPFLVEKNFGIRLPSVLEVIVLLFIYAAEILGEIASFYVTVPGWDTMLHTINGFLFAAIGFALVDIFNRNKQFTFRLSPVFLAIVAFCFSMTIGVLWEFFEFGMDTFFGLDMQKDFIIDALHTVTLDPTKNNVVITIEGIAYTVLYDSAGNIIGTFKGYLDIGLIDTMKDLLVNFIGAVIFCIIGFFYVKNRGEGRFAKHFIPTLAENEEETPPIIQSKRFRKKQKVDTVEDILKEDALKGSADTTSGKETTIILPDSKKEK